MDDDEVYRLLYIKTKKALENYKTYLEGGSIIGHRDEDAIILEEALEASKVLAKHALGG